MSASILVEGHELALERVACDFCGGREFVPAWHRMRHNVALDTVFCAACALCQTNPRPTPDATALFYRQLYMKYYENSSDDEGDYVTRSLTQARPRAEQLARLVGPSPRILEIGAGVGGFQRVAKEEPGWSVRGIEPGREQYEFCLKHGLDVRNLFFHELPTEDDGAYDAVASFHVLEHTQSPAAFLRRANRLLKPGGLCYLEVPNLSWPGGPFSQFLQLPHLFNFTAHTLRNYLTCIGGMRPLWVSEGRSALGMIAKKVSAPNDGVATEWEHVDLASFQRKLKTVERVFRLASMVPGLSVFSKVRATLFDV